MVLGAAFGDEHHAAVKIAGFAGDAAVDGIGDFMGHAAPAAGIAGELHAFFQQAVCENVMQAEFHRDLTAARLHCAGDEGLGIDRLPIGVGDGGIKARQALDIGAFGDALEEAGALQIGNDDGGDIGGHAPGPTFIAEGGQREGHRLDHRAAKSDGEAGLGRGGEAEAQRRGRQGGGEGLAKTAHLVLVSGQGRGCGGSAKGKAGHHEI